MKQLNVQCFFTLLFMCMMPMSLQAKIHSEFIEYEIAGESFRGYISYDDEITVKRPGVIVVHEWWGHNSYARKRAEMLAALGYTAFALDMYGANKLADHPENAKKLMQSVLKDISVAETRFNAAKQILQNHATVDSNKIAAIGYCFGGGNVLHMAQQGVDLAGVVSFHGTLTVSPVTNPVTAKILVFNGAADPFIKSEQITAFKQHMQTIKADMEFINYPGVQHSFTNPEANEFGQRYNLPLRYDAKADQDSWQKMNEFLNKIFN